MTTLYPMNTFYIFCSYRVSEMFRCFFRLSMHIQSGKKRNHIFSTARCRMYPFVCCAEQYKHLDGCEKKYETNSCPNIGTFLTVGCHLITYVRHQVLNAGDFKNTPTEHWFFVVLLVKPRCVIY